MTRIFSNKFSDVRLVFLLLFIILGMFMVVFPRYEIDTQSILDLRPYYTVPEVYALLEAYSPSERASYRLFSLTADMLFPIAYGLLYLSLLTMLIDKAFPDPGGFRRLRCVALGSPLFDILENTGIIVVLSLFPTRTPFWAGFAAVCTVGKWVFTGTFILCMIALTIRIIGRRFGRMSGISRPTRATERTASERGPS